MRSPSFKHPPKDHKSQWVTSAGRSAFSVHWAKRVYTLQHEDGRPMGVPSHPSSNRGTVSLVAKMGLLRREDNFCLPCKALPLRGSCQHRGVTWPGHSMLGLRGTDRKRDDHHGDGRQQGHQDVPSPFPPEMAN